MPASTWLGFWWDFDKICTFAKELVQFGDKFYYMTRTKCHFFLPANPRQGLTSILIWPRSCQEKNLSQALTFTLIYLAQKNLNNLKYLINFKAFQISVISPEAFLGQKLWESLSFSFLLTFWRPL